MTFNAVAGQQKGITGMRVSKKALDEIEAALREYAKEVELSIMTVSTKTTYLLHSENFVKWLKGEFTPGARKQ